MCEPYNGWTNRATSAVYDWISGDSGAASHWAGMATRAREEIAKQPTAGMNVEDWAKEVLAGKLRSHFGREAPSELAAGPWTELLEWGLEKVNWDEIAQTLLVS